LVVAIRREIDHARAKGPSRAWNWYESTPSASTGVAVRPLRRTAARARMPTTAAEERSESVVANAGL